MISASGVWGLYGHAPPGLYGSSLFTCGRGWWGLGVTNRDDTRPSLLLKLLLTCRDVRASRESQNIICTIPVSIDTLDGREEYSYPKTKTVTRMLCPPAHHTLQRREPWLIKTVHTSHKPHRNTTDPYTYVCTSGQSVNQLPDKPHEGTLVVEAGERASGRRLQSLPLTVAPMVGNEEQQRHMAISTERGSKAF